MMKVDKKYGYYFFFFMLVMVSYFIFFDLQPKWREFQVMSFEEKTLRKNSMSEQQLIAKQQVLAKKSQQIKDSMAGYHRASDVALVESGILSTLFRKGELANLTIDDIQPQAAQIIDGVTVMSVRLIASGSFVQFAEFVDLLAQEALPIVLTDFNYKAERLGKLNISAQLSSAFIAIAQQKIALAKQAILVRSPVIRDPFVVSHSANDLQRISIAKMKFVGYLHDKNDKNQFISLVKLPNGRAVDLRKDQVIGLEKAIVAALDESAVTLLVDGKKIKAPYLI